MGHLQANDRPLSNTCARSAMADSCRIRPLFVITGLAGALWLLVGYLLPGSGADRLTAGGFFTVDDPDPAPLPMVFLTGGAFLVVALNYANDVEDDWFKQLFILGILVCGNCFVAAALRERLSQSWGCQYILITLALTAGLLAAKLTGGFARAFPMIVVLGTCQSALALLTLSHSRFFSGDVQRATGTFHDPQDISRVLLFCLPVSTSMAISKDLSLPRRCVWWTCSTVMLAAEMFTWDRGAAIAISIAVTYVAWSTIRHRVCAIALTAVLILMPIVTWAARSTGELNERSAARSNAGHYNLAREGLVLVLMHPLGVGADRIFLPVYQSGGSATQYTIDPKNLCVYWLDILGAPGGLMLIALVVSGHRIIKAAPALPRVALAGVWLSVLVAGVSDTPIGTIETLPSTALAGVVIGCMLILPSYGSQNGLPSPSAQPTVYVDGRCRNSQGEEDEHLIGPH